MRHPTPPETLTLEDGIRKMTKIISIPALNISLVDPMRTPVPQIPFQSFPPLLIPLSERETGSSSTSVHQYPHKQSPLNTYYGNKTKQLISTVQLLCTPPVTSARHPIAWNQSISQDSASEKKFIGLCLVVLF